MATSQIQKFYENTNVFVTGATGFLGKILIEKLLRSTSLSTLYILVRAKKGKDTETRIKDLFDEEVFDQLRRECPKFMHKIVGLDGDVSYPDLGLSQSNKEVLIEKIDIMFHCAATVKFDENLKTAYYVNVNGAKEIIKIAKSMKNLKSLMHVSTAYAHAYLSETEERFYDHSVDYEEMGSILEKLTESQIDDNTTRLKAQWPNTYTFTKALAESMIRETSGSLPIAIFRPSIVISTYKEPLEGWIDNMYGPTGVCAGVNSGLFRVIRCNRHKKADLVPVDMCVAALIAAAWENAEKKEEKRSPENIKIYNYVGTENNLSWNEFCAINRMYSVEYPSNRCIWAQSFTITDNIYVYLLLKILYHLIPALLVDFVGMLSFRNVGMLGMYKKIHRFSDVLSFFTTREWYFTNDNVVKLWNKLDEADKTIFSFDMSSIDWWAYYKSYVLGIRQYTMKEPIENLKEARRRNKIFNNIHQVLLVVIFFTLSILLWTFLQRIFSSPSRPCLDMSNM